MARYEQGFKGERRTAFVGVQLTPSERSELAEAARIRGLGLSEYVRTICFRNPGPAPEIRRSPEAAKLMHELRAVGNNLNQIARTTNIHGEVTREEDLVEVLGLLRAAILHVLDLS